MQYPNWPTDVSVTSLKTHLQLVGTLQSRMDFFFFQNCLLLRTGACLQQSHADENLEKKPKYFGESPEGNVQFSASSEASQITMPICFTTGTEPINNTNTLFVSPCVTRMIRLAN